MARRRSNRQTVRSSASPEHRRSSRRRAATEEAEAEKVEDFVGEEEKEEIKEEETGKTEEIKETEETEETEETTEIKAEEEDGNDGENAEDADVGEDAELELDSNLIDGDEKDEDYQEDDEAEDAEEAEDGEDAEGYGEDDSDSPTTRRKSRRTRSRSGENEPDSGNDTGPDGEDEVHTGDDTEDFKTESNYENENENGITEAEAEGEAEGEAEDGTPKKRRRGRPPGSKNKTTLFRESMGLTPTPKRRRNDESDGEERKRRKGTWLRGRAALKAKRMMVPQPIDEEGKPIPVEGGEAMLPSDPKGDTKVSRDGTLLGGRKYKVATFKLESQGDKLFVLATDAARATGYRDSYLLFQCHKRLYKVMMTEAEKNRLIATEVIPRSYRGRSVAALAARSFFVEFGARSVVDGKRVWDDYYEDKARELGYIPGEPALNDEVVSGPKTAAPASGGSEPKNASQVWQAQFANKELRNRKKNLTEDNWLLEHASAAIQYNWVLRDRRFGTQNPKGILDPFTGVAFVPASTQSNVCIWEKMEPKNGEKSRKVTYETVMRTPNNCIRTGLRKVDPTVLSLVSPEVRQAIVAQQEQEAQWQTL